MKITKVGNRFRAMAAVWMIATAALSACGGVSVTKYDDHTYQQVAFVKPEILAVYDSFKIDPINDAKVEGVDLKLAQYQTYEAGKGPANIEMTQQLETIQKLFKKHVAERKRDGPWNDTVIGNHKEIISEACDIAIKTERAKNK